MAELLRGNGNLRKIEPKDNQRFTWIEIRALLGDSVHLILLDKTNVLLVQEKSSRQANDKATALVRKYLFGRKAPADKIAMICGDALLARHGELRLEQILAGVELVI